VRTRARLRGERSFSTPFASGEGGGERIFSSEREKTTTGVKKGKKKQQQPLYAPTCREARKGAASVQEPANTKSVPGKGEEEACSPPIFSLQKRKTA